MASPASDSDRPAPPLARIAAAATGADLAAALAAFRQAPSSDPATLLEDCARLSRAAHRRAVELALSAGRAAGDGDPPVAFSFLLLGSQGRGEPTPGSDQDHAMILADYPQDGWGEVEPYFISLSERIEALLAEAGFAPCPGGVSCRNPVWRKPLSEWKDQLRGWCADPTPRAVRCATILYDFAPGYGDEALAAQLREFAMGLIARNQHLVRALYEEAGCRRVPLTAFGRFVTPRSGPDKGTLDLKGEGLNLLVANVRLLALRHGVSPPSTRERLAALGAAGVLSPREEADCLESLAALRRLVLAAELARPRAGRAPASPRARPDGLAPADRDALRGALRAIARLQASVHASYGNVFF